MSATLEHALVNGILAHASEQVGVDPKDRPAATCPVCGEAVTWKAGDVKVPHVAHLPSSTCPTSSPETMEHFNAKMRLAEMLASERAVPLSGLCSAGHFVRVVWSIGAWTRAVREYRIGTRRPDVVLLNESGETVAAVEVFHTHAVNEAKAADLAASGVPWIEVSSHHALAWDGESPLRAVRHSAARDFDAACRRCEELASAAVAGWYKKKREAAEAKRLSLMANPPSLRVAIAVAMRGNPGTAVVGAMVMRDDAKPNLRAVDEEITSKEAAYIALEHALRLVESRCGGRGATIYTNFSMRPHLPVRRESYSDSENKTTEMKRRIADAIDRTNSLVLWSGTNNVKDPDTSRWISMVYNAAKQHAKVSS